MRKISTDRLASPFLELSPHPPLLLTLSEECTLHSAIADFLQITEQGDILSSAVFIPVLLYFLVISITVF